MEWADGVGLFTVLDGGAFGLHAFYKRSEYGVVACVESDHWYAQGSFNFGYRERCWYGRGAAVVKRIV